MKTTILLLLFLSSLKGYTQNFHGDSSFLFGTDKMPLYTGTGLLPCTNCPDPWLTLDPVQAKIHVDTLTFLGHLSDEYLNDHGYYREKPGYLTRKQYKDILNLPGTQPPTIDDLMYAPERDNEERLKRSAADIVELFNEYANLPINDSTEAFLYYDWDPKSRTYKSRGSYWLTAKPTFEGFVEFLRKKK